MLGAEALLRWECPRRGTLGPDRFIPWAEATGLIHPLGFGLLSRVARDCEAGLLEHLGQDSTVAINLSPVQFTEPDFIPRFAELLAQSRLPRERCKLEVTETAIADNPTAVTAGLNLLREFGFRIILDDFGTGYSSLTHLVQLPIDGIKIDRSFVAQAGYCDKNYAVIAAMLELAIELGLSVTAEGIETRAQLNLLAKHGCRSFQGFYFSRPTPFRKGRLLR
ncbi:diguanylate cyclase/phosphodiesterase (GGDEF & EAL domain protein) with PAS/PAC sensor(s) [Pseudohaliea rubra DSM 19751]|uniref:Diguanylate cyclase/phosphodiesterase (GGDEF & EAL domain protein) with PAS/PAC sensor(S) n=1 Tax=Pseudohaliea rubra DSM 19751 TaxID=1265313 RepID=A0A095XZP3_9GAMM|nr:diguanylate cyclase/phosphodiesterase (GGDEF & EAL domain protein) with PAS/PAC sensor(s) [Pseudohaliea rubra DSM 19751]